MFLNNSASTRSLLPHNENAMTGHRSSKTLSSDNGTRRMPFNENSLSKGLKTPHRNKDTLGSNPTTQKRRALGDISNRKAAGGGGTNGKANGSLVLKPSSKPTSSNVSNKKALFPASSSSLNRFQPTKTPILKLSNATNKARLGAPNNFILPKRSSSNVTATPKTNTTTTNKTKSSSEYDEIKTTRWAQADTEYEKYGSAIRITEEELNGVSKFRKEMFDRIKKESKEEMRMECQEAEKNLKRREAELFEKQLEMLSSAESNVLEEEEDIFARLDEDNGFFDLMDERRLSGTDPLSLCGEI